MAKSRVSRSKKNGNTTNGNETNVTMSELQEAAASEAQSAAEARVQPANDGRRNIVPINLEEEIRRRAYEIYEERGGISGDEHGDWLRAEREVLSRYQQTA